MKGSAMLVHNMKGSRPAPAGGTIINLLCGLIFFGLVAAGVFWVIKTAGQASEQYTTAVVDTQHKSVTLACQMNLRSIAQCLQTYAITNEEFPDSQRELETYCGSSKLWRCPDPCGVEYVYIPGARPDMPSTTVLVYEPKPVHAGRCNVLFLGGQIALLTPEELEQAITAMTAPRQH